MPESEARRLLDLGQHLQPQSKLRELEKLLAITAAPDEPVIVFTEFRATARAIAHRTGGILMDSSLTDRQLQANLRHFREGTHSRVLVATPRLAEGINLQTCRTIVHFDLPWNPFRIEQRIGRVHRVGQKSSEVFISTISSEETIEQLIREFLKKKLKMFEGVVGRMTHRVLEFAIGGSVEDRIGEILTRVASRSELELELLRVDLSDLGPLIGDESGVQDPPKSVGPMTTVDQVLDDLRDPD